MGIADLGIVGFISHNLVLFLLCYVGPALVTLALWVACGIKYKQPHNLHLGLFVAAVPLLNIYAVVALGNMLVEIPRDSSLNRGQTPLTERTNEQAIQR